jgi:hypothetical protein
MKVFVIGDSHTRSLNNTKFINPFYAGPGSELNLTDKLIKNIYKKIDDFFMLNIINPNDILLICFGESFIRYYFNNTLYPHKLNIDKWDTVYNNKYIKYTNISGIQKGIDMYIKLIHNIQTKHKVNTQYTNKT